MAAEGARDAERVGGSPVGRASAGYGPILGAIEGAFDEPCDMHDPFIACTKRSEKAAVAVLRSLLALPVEQRIGGDGDGACIHRLWRGRHLEGTAA